MADTVEATFRLAPVPITAAPQPTGESPLSAEGIKSVIRLRGMRVRELANHFGTDEATIRLLITPENGLKVADRGWVQTI